MNQIYFLSIIVNLIVGIVLIRDILMERSPAFGKLLEDIGDSDLFRLIAGIAAVAVGVLKLLTVSPDDVRIVGDLFPALAGMAAGLTLLSEYFTRKKMSLPPWAVRGADFLSATRRIWGLVAIAAAVLHFFFYKALFL